MTKTTPILISELLTPTSVAFALPPLDCARASGIDVNAIPVTNTQTMTMTIQLSFRMIPLGSGRCAQAMVSAPRSAGADREQRSNGPV